MYMEYVDDADYGDEPEPARRRSWRILGWVSIGLSVVMVATSLTAYAAYRKLNGNISHENVDAAIGPNRPKKLNRSLNILMLGSDTRAGANASYGRSMKNEPARADTTILLHLSPGGNQAIGISFPRDLMVPIPACRRKDGTRSAPQSAGMINSAFSIAGATCTIATIEAMTNVKIDHFAQVDFAGFKGIINALGGVKVCLPKDVNDPQAHLHLKKGIQVVKGEDALGFVRSRHGMGDGSDLSRIKRQQLFLGSVAKTAMSGGVLGNPAKLYALLNAGTKTLTTDDGLSPSVMMQIAQSMQGMSAGKLRFVTAPWTAYAPDPNRVALAQPAAGQFFNMVRNDKDIQEPPKAGASAPKVPPSQVRVRVLNGTGVHGLAQRYADQLTAQGFKVIQVASTTPQTTTRVLYGTGADQQAATLTGVLSGVTAAPRQGGTPGVVDLVIGPNAGPVKGKSASIPKLQGEIRADGNICKAT
ncbi:MAG: cell envelope-related transcriptional attenuator [Streptosporangiaceae bacterium]|jgi:LCP family protein required for cell wall assembly|nr:cell envelope-related transcriptional attenuator [Streptosporangiaceae bacterium]